LCSAKFRVLFENISIFFNSLPSNPKFYLGVLRVTEQRDGGNTGNIAGNALSGSDLISVHLHLMGLFSLSLKLVVFSPSPFSLSDLTICP
jgi:hypothetical protein